MSQRGGAFANFKDENTVVAVGYGVQFTRLRAVAREQFALEDERKGLPKTRVLMDCVDTKESMGRVEATFVRKDRQEPMPWQ